MSSPQPVEVWFEFASSYSYLAVMRVEAAARAAGVPLQWRPFLLGPVFLSLGWNDSPFNIYPPKGRYMWRDMARLAAKYDIPFRLPSQFPRNALLAAQVACLGQTQPWIAAFARAAMRANFGEDRDIGQPEVIADILTALALPADTLIAEAQADDNAQALQRQTEQATALGIFGAPTFLVGGEMFWGNDRLEDTLAWACRPA
ncbi:2-hydroxychromene-2-carboxylate isomerase [Denitromonas iodatirespirans]|uniref:2-hydroxychromene-2-carboxylate isomerase n=1 Tax=Denitromonas iodatirespirans TaxID=2795389 RepID=A0A944D8V3_DENI1|nr:2-hydroxychromene-2-carboxylate isomerase [Denitromonas iodatirespirans]MBT0960047.1 2-hydroxychromene-2-carboxylate isomerase [Denitromonas iodatirespirans]